MCSYECKEDEIITCAPMCIHLRKETETKYSMELIVEIIAALVIPNLQQSSSHSAGSNTTKPSGQVNWKFNVKTCHRF